MRQKSKSIHTPEFLARVPQAIHEVQHAIINAEQNPLVLVEAIAEHRDLMSAAQLIADDCSSQYPHIPEQTREIASHLEIGIRVGVELAGVTVTVPHHARAFLKEKAMLGVGACFGLLIWVISSDDLKVWQILAALLLTLAIAGLTHRITRRSTTRAVMEFLTSGRN